MAQFSKTSGALLATAAAALFAGGLVQAAETGKEKGKAAEEAKVQCYGINACKGQSECRTATNACKGQNSCKGKGFLTTATKEECKAKGGKLQQS
ncbi:hypothetical protein EVC37_16090 [Methylocaldum sp. BRCS4]|jgi:hypothetical protein|uniref:BufA2 family periplasmic bufferin-type metallophore n=1 Tax=Methylocaldum sp. 14B TaxID=1912213 RepID=UPI00098ACE1C|nr:hypothetical protein [Methylocaldum sp. 14B]MVF23122.1 hypothetical protein [Methylocaldum sp. BRCS4]